MPFLNESPRVGFAFLQPSMLFSVLKYHFRLTSRTPELLPWSGRSATWPFFLQWPFYQASCNESNRTLKHWLLVILWPHCTCQLEDWAIVELINAKKLNSQHKKAHCVTPPKMQLTIFLVTAQKLVDIFHFKTEPSRMSRAVQSYLLLTSIIFGSCRSVTKSMKR